MVQSNSIGSTMQTAFGIPSWIVGLALVAICGFIFIGGVQRLASVTEKVVPIMAAIFLLGGLIVLIARIKYVPATFGMIFKYAFAPQAIIGAGFGYAIKTPFPRVPSAACSPMRLVWVLPPTPTLSRMSRPRTTRALSP